MINQNLKKDQYGVYNVRTKSFRKHLEITRLSRENRLMLYLMNRVQYLMIGVQYLMIRVEYLMIRLENLMIKVQY